MSSPKLPITPAQLAALPPDFRALVQAIIDHYEARIAELESRINNLEGRTNKTPQNSSLPPSSQHPHAKPASAKPKSKKRPGGQLGHPKHERALVPTDQCEEVVTLRPTACRKCGRTLKGNDCDPLRHQVWELPRSSHLSPSTNVIVCAVPIARRPPAPNCHRAFLRVRPVAAWSPSQPC